MSQFHIAVFKKNPEIFAKDLIFKFKNLGLEKAEIYEIYSVEKKFSKKEQKSIAEILQNPVLENSAVFSSSKNFLEIFKNKFFDFAVFVGFLPGVTDNLGATARETIEDALGKKFNFPQENIFSSRIFLFSGKISTTGIKEISKNLGNNLIEKIEFFSKKDFLEKFQIALPKVKIIHSPNSLEIDLEISDRELEKLGKFGIQEKNGNFRGPLALPLNYLKTIRNYFRKKKRNPTDIELETFAQTWSEHCKHTIFSSPLDEIENGIFHDLIRKTTEKIRAKKGRGDFCVSVFSDNSGAIEFDDNFLITDKVETHNSPSALDPFGGAITGIVGVNRDCLGFGLGAKPVANRFGFFFGNPNEKKKIFRDKNCQIPTLSSRQILDGVVAGIRSGGNESGIPTVQGICYFDESYRGKPLVFCGTVGLIPKKIGQKKTWKKKALPGDKILMIGGRVGADGIHGATFSSEILDENSPATAVQIGDPITQKKFSDAFIYEIRDKLWHNSITDCGAGGLSSAIGEMAEESNGCKVFLEKVPTKYPNLSPWEIWISESQERMVVAVDPKKVTSFQKILNKHKVESTEIGEFTDSGKCQVFFDDKKVLDLDLEFLHHGIPKTKLTSKKPINKKISENKKLITKDLKSEILSILSHNNIAAKNFIFQQFDHEVQGNSVLKPICGTGKISTNATVIAPVLGNLRGVILSSGFCPQFSEIDPVAMGENSVEMAVRNAVSVGADPDKLAILDNFCWCDSKNPYRLWQLKKTAIGMSRAAENFATPFISGKDSMFNDFSGFSEKGKKIQISILPTLLISAIGVIENIENSISPDFKFSDDEIWILGETFDELAGSEYLVSKKINDGKIPQVDFIKSKENFSKFFSASKKNLISAAMAVDFGGIAVAISKMVIAGQLGAKIDLQKIPTGKNKLSSEKIMFSQSASRIIFSINPKNSSAIKKIFGNCAQKIGKISSEKKLKILENKKILADIKISELEKKYFSTFSNF